MRTQLSEGQLPCLTIPGKQPVGWQRHDEGTKTPSRFGWIVLMVVTLLLLVPAAALSKGGGGKGGGGGGGDTTVDVVDFGDVFGDLMHILRDGTTGQPIFAQRWVEMPEALPGFGWGYCAIGVDLNGVEIPFKPYSCDLDPVDPEDVVEVDYFGRLNASRVQERNQRMHFNETITNIKQAVRLRLDPTGRLDLGFEDPDPELGDPICKLDANYCIWTTVDSPMENMALYQRMMKYGHIATDPAELDLWWHGDPKLTAPTHPALDVADFLKFEQANLHNMLPDRVVWDDDGNFIRDYADCFDLQNKAIVPCLPPEELILEDFNTSAELLGAAGGKHNFFTVHLVQYLNRFLRITQTTEFAAATLNTLPAMYQSCDVYKDGELLEGDPWTSGEEAPEAWDLEVVVLTYENCDVIDVDEYIPNYDDFPNVQELFMNFGQSAYVRSGDGGIWDERTAPVALEATLSIISIVIDPESTTPRVQEATGTPIAESTPGADSDIWLTVDAEPLLAWILIANDYTPAVMNIHNFVDAASDALRAIEFFHNYSIPENLYCTYRPDLYCPELPEPPVDPNL